MVLSSFRGWNSASVAQKDFLFTLNPVCVSGFPAWCMGKPRGASPAGQLSLTAKDFRLVHPRDLWLQLCKLEASAASQHQWIFLLFFLCCRIVASICLQVICLFICTSTCFQNRWLLGVLLLTAVCGLALLLRALGWRLQVHFYGPRILARAVFCRQQRRLLVKLKSGIAFLQVGSWCTEMGFSY